jgi:hypothetical protein
MDIDLTDVELGFVVNLKTLRRVLCSLSIHGRRWWVASDPRDAIDMGGILVGHGDPCCVDRLNTVLFKIPILTDLMPRAGVDSLVFLMAPSAISTTDPGYYFEHGRVVQDDVADLEAFCQPIKTALLERLSGHGRPDD